MRQLIKLEKPQFLLLREAKMKDSIVLQERSYFLKNSIGLTINSLGSSKGLCTLWNPQQYQLKESKATQHWLLVKLAQISTSKNFIVTNINMPNQYHEKQTCWIS